MKCTITTTSWQQLKKSHWSVQDPWNYLFKKEALQLLYFENFCRFIECHNVTRTAIDFRDLQIRKIKTKTRSDFEKLFMDSIEMTVLSLKSNTSFHLQLVSIIKWHKAFRHNIKRVVDVVVWVFILKIMSVNRSKRICLHNLDHTVDIIFHASVTYVLRYLFYKIYIT